MNRDITINNHFIDYIKDWTHYEYFLLGSYGSSKSFNTAIKLVIKAMQEKRKILVVRKVFATLKDSCYEDIKEAINFLGVESLFSIYKSPLEIVCRNGSRFLFKGLDDKAKLKSIKDISIVWIEEGEGTLEDYKELKDRMRVEGIEPHIILTTNPQNKTSWIYTNFFKDEEEGTFVLDDEELYKKRQISLNGVYYHHSTYKDNKFLNKQWIENLEKEKNEALINTKRLGRFGSLGLNVFTNVSKITKEEFEKVNINSMKRFNGLDFGFVTSYNALVMCLVDRRENNLYIYKEHYARGQTNKELMEDIRFMKGLKVTCDSAEPKTIEELRRYGVLARGSKKGAGSVASGIKKLQGFDNIFILEDCPNTYREFKGLEHLKNDRTGKIDENKYNIDPHSVDAARYALEEYKHFDFKNRTKRKPIGL